MRQMCTQKKKKKKMCTNKIYEKTSERSFMIDVEAKKNIKSMAYNT